MGLVTPARSQTSGCDSPGAITVLTKDWTKIATPRFSLQTVDETMMSGIAADSTDIDHFFVTSTKEVMETRDGGCSWKSVYQDNAALEMELQIAQGDSPAGKLILSLYRADGLRILTSKDWGKTWTESADSAEQLAGMAPCTTWRGGLVVAPGDPKVIYLCAYPYYTYRLNDFSYFIYRSTDGGDTWGLASDLNTQLAKFAESYGGPIGYGRLQLFVDPLDDERLWAVGQVNSGGFQLRTKTHAFLAESTDGAATWQELRRVEGWPYYGDLNVSHRKGREPSLLLVSGSRSPECPVEDTGCLMHSPDAGSTWGILPPQEGLSAVHLQAGRRSNRLMVITAMAGGGTYVHRYDRVRNTWVDISPPDGEQYPIRVVSSLEGKRTAFFVFKQNGIDRYTGKV